MSGEGDDIWFIFWMWQILLEAQIEGLGWNVLIIYMYLLME
jgi:hypothetical protein